MTGSATFARSSDVAAVARVRLDRAAASAAALEAAQRSMVEALVELWPTSAWLAAGARTAKSWLLAYTGVSYREAQRLERIAGLCFAQPTLADAVVSGTLSMRRAERLGVAVTDERAPFLAGSLPAFLGLNAQTSDEDAFDAAVRHWVDLVDQELTPRRDHPHKVVVSQRLFGGGEIHADLAPAAFVNVATALDAWTQDPDPTDAPHQRTLAERRADALDDLAHFALTGHDDLDDDDVEVWARDTFDGTSPTDDLDETLAAADETAEDDGLVDPMVVLRRRLRRAEQHRRRRTHRRVRARSGAVVNVHIDLHTLTGRRGIDDLDDLVLRGDGWNITRQAAQRLTCDSALVATLFAGPNKVLDVNDAAEQFTRRQRRALAARDGHCVFPSCTRPPRHCDTHHLHPRHHNGPTRVDNAALLCRFHHRLIHEHRWQLTIHDGHWIATDPHGTHWTGRPTPLPPTDPPPHRRTPDQRAD